MDFYSFLNLIKNKLSVILIIMAGFFVLGVGLTLVQPLKYSSSLRLLVVQNASGVADPYATTRANEYLSEILSKVSYSTTFFDQVLNSGLQVNPAYFGQTNKKISKTWSKTIDVRPVGNTGIISVTAYHPQKDQAERIARAVGTVLITQNGNYHGLGDKVTLRLLDDPITSTYPVKPNLLINAGLSIVLGLVFALLLIYLFPDFKFFEHQLIVANEQEAIEAISQVNLYQEPDTEVALDFSLEPEIEADLPVESFDRDEFSYQPIKPVGQTPTEMQRPAAPRIDWHQEF